ncbi:MAG: HAD-IIA family hydrolase [Chloroflexi bacterium]|nr:HAD-IIA family hydrolase [Chloroflexota bacterium]
MFASTAFLSNICGLIIDIDGVLWRGTEVLPGVPEFFRFLRARGIRFIIASNNSSRPAAETIARLARIGVAVSESELLTSAEATALYLPRIAPRGSSVYLVGGLGIARALKHAGYRLVSKNAAVVVVGLDLNLTYAKLKRAVLEIQGGAKFIGTNPDKTFPGEEGFAPGAGAILAAIQAATSVAPIVIGKPERAMFDVALEKLDAEPPCVAMLGDRLDTDIEGAHNVGLKTILVLSGVTSRVMLTRSRITPDLVCADIHALHQLWDAQ